jgi:hypothetical protein
MGQVGRQTLVSSLSKLLNQEGQTGQVLSAREDWGLGGGGNVKGRNPLGQGFSDFFAGVPLNEI